MREGGGAAQHLREKSQMILTKKIRIEATKKITYRLLFLFLFPFASLFSTPLRYGLESIPQSLIQKCKLHCRPIGLVTNQTGIDHTGHSSLNALRSKHINITRIFAPEHGYTGTVLAGKSVEDSIEPVTHIPIVSLYSHAAGLVGKTINANNFADLDVIIFDMQDSGMRHYTYISTLMRVLEACAQYNKLCIVLDRPNLLGARMEGPLVDPDLISFISIAPIPLRHGLTIGELAYYFNHQILQKKARLIVVPMQNYSRTQTITTLKKPLSPNLTNIQASRGYSFLGLLGELSPLNVGVGTKHAFRAIMVPTSVKVPPALWPHLQHLLHTYGISSTRHTTIDERTKKKVTGLLLQFGDIGKVKTYSLFLDIVSLFIKHGITLTCAPTFDKSVGIKALRTAIEQKESLEPFKRSAQETSQQFYGTVKHLLLYQPHPRVD